MGRGVDRKCEVRYPDIPRHARVGAPRFRTAGQRGLWLRLIDSSPATMDIIKGVPEYFRHSQRILNYLRCHAGFTKGECHWRADFVIVYPFEVGLDYFLPLNLSVFRVVFPRLLEVGAYFSECGRNLKGPYRSFETAGAWIVIAFVALWGSRKYLKQVSWTIRQSTAEICR